MMLNAISVDVEEYFQATNISSVVAPQKLSTLASRVEYSTQKVLTLFESCKIKGTFFVLASVAKNHPQLIREIVSGGHELASHGVSHKLVYDLSPAEFFTEAQDSKKLLEDVGGVLVRGYRAPNFSITERVPWAHGELARAGYQYDSSVFPVWHPRYQNLKRSLLPEIVRTEHGSIVEIPLAVCALKIFGKELRLPMAGGAYLRLFPLAYFQSGLRKIQREGRNFVCYFHPWELDTEQVRLPELNWLTSIRHYGGTEKMEARLKALAAEFSFSTIAEAYGSLLKQKNS